jgi:hypothetical protein
MSSLFDIVLFATGPIYALFGATFGYKTYRKFEFVANITLAVILLFWPDPLIKLMVTYFILTLKLKIYLNISFI